VRRIIKNRCLFFFFFDCFVVSSSFPDPFSSRATNFLSPPFYYLTKKINKHTENVVILGAVNDPVVFILAFFYF